MPPSVTSKPTTVLPSCHSPLRRETLAARALLSAIRAYKVAVSPYLGGGCRYSPSCADYAAQAIRAHGAVRGAWLAVRRLARCHPWGGYGFDPIPHR